MDFETLRFRFATSADVADCDNRKRWNDQVSASRYVEIAKNGILFI